MTHIDEQRCASVGMKMSILCVLIGAAVPAGMMIKEFLQSLPGGVSSRPNDHPKWEILIGTILTLIALSIAAALLGKMAGKVICRRRSSIAGAILIGILLAISCMVVGVLVGAAFTVVLEPSLDSAGVAGVFGLITVVVGALPAILLGILYGTVVRTRLAKVEGWEPASLA